MFKSSPCIVLLTIATAFLPGCAAMTAMKSTASETMSSLDPSTKDYHDPTGDSSDPWVHEAGDQARGHHVKDKDSDPPWLRNLLMSQKARDIESNLGIE